MSIPIPLLWKLRIKAALSPITAPDGFPTTGPRLIVALAADYGNLGDVALTRALLGFAASNLPSHQPCLLPAGRLFYEVRGMARHASPDDVIVIVGGGNMGNLYPDLEEARLQVVRRFPNNRIISFPQSIDFSDNSEGRVALNRSRKIYQSHRKLTLFARDKESFQKMRSAFPGVDVAIAPDTVLSMDAPVSSRRHIPVITCLRQDKEAVLSMERREEILAAIRQTHPSCLQTDTIVEGPRLDFPSYERHLDTLLCQFSQASCIVTDRLHGLIFSVITETPCVVVDNNNHKIRSLIETWLPELPSVRLLSNPTAPEVMNAIVAISGFKAPRPNLSAFFAPLCAALKR